MHNTKYLPSAIPSDTDRNQHSHIAYLSWTQTEIPGRWMEYCSARQARTSLYRQLPSLAFSWPFIGRITENEVICISSAYQIHCLKIYILTEKMNNSKFNQNENVK